MRHKIGAYIRVSTEEQAAAIDGSLDNQQYRLKAFVDLKNAQEKGWGKIVEFYIDDGYSAKDTRRPAYQRMMSDIRKKRVDLILVTDLSRLSRNISDFCGLMSDLEKVIAQFLSIKEQFDTSTPAGKMMIYNMINLAQFEREQVSERVALGVHARSMRGLLNGGRPILGYDKDPKKPGTYVINSRESEDVRKIFRHFLNTGSRAKTILLLEQEEIRPKLSRGRFDAKVNWSTGTLGNLLSAAAYIGYREVNRSSKGKDQDKLKPHQKYKRVKANWPAIISEDDFNQAQELLREAQKSERVRLDGADDRFYILSGLLRCHECGQPLAGHSAHGQKTVHRYYDHTRAGAKFGCKIKRIPAQEAEGAVLGYLFDAIRDAGYLNRIEENIRSMRNVRSINIAREKRELKTRMGELNLRLDNLVFIQGQTSSGGTVQYALKTIEVLAEERVELEAKISRLEEQPDQSQLVTDSVELIAQRLREFERGFKRASGAMKKRLLQKVIKQIVVTSDGLEVFMLLADQENTPSSQFELNTDMQVKNGDKPVRFLAPKGSERDRQVLDLSSRIGKIGGADADRTRDLYAASVMLSQLSYRPNRCNKGPPLYVIQCALSSSKERIFLKIKGLRGLI